MRQIPNMLRRRLQRLEKQLGPPISPERQAELSPPEVMNINFVDDEGNVVDTMVIELPRPRPFQRRNQRALNCDRRAKEWESGEAERRTLNP